MSRLFPHFLWGPIICISFLISSCSSAATTSPAESTLSQSQAKISIYSPASPSSVPVVLAAQQLPDAEVTIFTNHSQANTLFLRGDVDILITGLSVGVSMFKNEAPVQVVNSYVTDLTYLVTTGEAVEDFSDLSGEEIYLPFEGSPIEEMTRYLAQQDGLNWDADLSPVYSPFPASVELLKEGKAAAVVLPEPFVSMVAPNENVFVSLNYRQAWDSLAGGTDGYPQVAAFVNRDWAAEHAAEITEFNQMLAEAIESIEQDPAAAIESAGGSFSFPAPVLLGALKRTGFAPLTDEDLADNINTYYQTIGTPLDDSFGSFFYHHP